MPKIKFADATIRALKPPTSGQVDYFDTLLPSFGVRVTPKGRKTFFVFDRVGGKLKRMTLGRYGPSPMLGLAEAREKAREWKTTAERGADPVVEAKRQEATAAASTFAKAVEKFLADRKAHISANTYRDYSTFLVGPAVADWRGRQLASISRADVTVVLDNLDAQEHFAASNKAVAYLRVFFNWCADPDRGNLIDRAPTDRLRMRHDNTKRDRALTDEELAVVAAVLRDDDGTLRVMYGLNDAPPLADLWRDFFLVLALTGQRRNEVAGMMWSELRELDGKEPIWDLPGSRTKNGLPHLVPLSPAVVTILQRRKMQADAVREIPDASAKRNGGKVERLPFVFSGSGGEEPVSGFSKAKGHLDARVSALCTALGRPVLPHWTGHDLRRTMVTGMNELGIAPHVVEAVVNHVSGAAKAGVAGVYNRARYLPERRAALNVWAARVAALEPMRAS
ncbi:MAG: site-specific integrase [Mesorhizobium sp.]|uniref:tyrosine-type recombinase/integrase n=1 Tax=Mesorhizobium sp. TaxID=1871066 RepID=UPI000FE7F15B|nr:site-specific integrase [Mesorhizobium sp.]RWH07133.1 MAG: site-specific integrase [Mesorhizobium sp.]